MNKSSDRDSLISKVKKTIDSNHLLDIGDRVLIGVSGGPDSMCLLHILKTLSVLRGYSIEAAHVNHSLRGDASLSDQAFVSDYCRTNGIPFHTCTVDVAGFSREHGMGIEEAARFVRYRYFQECVQNHPAKITVAHHRQDQVETILLNLIRGCGLDGMRGMEYISGNIIRPLLDCTREEIISYITTCGVPFRIDLTNGESCADRNRIRLDLVPYIDNLFGRDISSSILTTRLLCLQDADYLDRVSSQVFSTLTEGDSLPCDDSMDLSSAILSRVIRHLFEKAKGDRKNLTYRQTESILEMVAKRKEGAVIHLSDGMCATIRRQRLIIMTKARFEDHRRKSYEELCKGRAVQIPLRIPSEQVEEGIKMYICTKFVEKPAEVDYNAMARYFTAETVRDSVWRYRKEGDWIRPNRNSGKKTIRKYFIDEKVPRNERDALLLLAKGSEILWIPEWMKEPAGPDTAARQLTPATTDGGDGGFVYIRLEHRS